MSFRSYLFIFNTQKMARCSMRERVRMGQIMPNESAFVPVRVELMVVDCNRNARTNTTGEIATALYR